MKNTVKTVVAIFTILAIVSPIKNVDLGNLFSKFSEFEIESSFVEKQEKTKLEKLKIDVESNLEKNGYFGLKVDFAIDEKGWISNVYVDLKGLVLKDDQLNINKYTNIIAVIKDFVNIDIEDVVFYE